MIRGRLASRTKVVIVTHRTFISDPHDAIHFASVADIVLMHNLRLLSNRLLNFRL